MHVDNHRSSLLTVPQVLELTGLGRSTLYQEIMSGRLRSMKIGRLRRIPSDELQAWIDRHLEEAA